MSPHLFSEIESILWKNLLALAERKNFSAEFLRGYFAACEDLDSFLKKAEFLVNTVDAFIRSGGKKRYDEAIKILRNYIKT